jgi:hypothetical protein
VADVFVVHTLITDDIVVVVGASHSVRAASTGEPAVLLAAGAGATQRIQT